MVKRKIIAGIMVFGRRILCLFAFIFLLLSQRLAWSKYLLGLAVDPSQAPGGVPPSPPHPTFFPQREAVKKFREREIGGPQHAQGKAKFTPPKQALFSPWPRRY
jgi:hypothetical protein